MGVWENVRWFTHTYYICFLFKEKDWCRLDVWKVTALTGYEPSCSTAVLEGNWIVVDNQNMDWHTYVQEDLKDTQKDIRNVWQR